MIAEYKKAFPGMIDVERINVAEQPKLAAQMDVKRVPMFMLRQDTSFIDQSVGTWTLPELTHRITEYARRRPAQSAGQAKPTLRYDGKTFDEWRTAWQTELSTEKRLEAVQALAAFGANGYGKEAAEAIFEVVEGSIGPDRRQFVRRKTPAACVDAFTTGRTTGGYRIKSSTGCRW